MASGEGPAEGGESKAVWVIPIISAMPRQIRGGGDLAVVSPDGNQIAFRSITAGRHEAWVMGANGENARKLADAAPRERVVRLHWSPDGAKVGVLHERSDAEKFEVTIAAYDLAGGERSELLSDPRIRAFAWAPGGRLIYSRLEPTSTQGEMNLWEVRLDSAGARATGAPRRITDWVGFSFSELTVTADGKRLVFVKQHDQSDVYVGELQGTRLLDAQRITLDERQDRPSDWSPDSRLVLFHSDRNGSWDIFKQDISRRVAEEFILGTEDQRDPRFTSDGAWVLYWSHPKLESTFPQSVQLLRIPANGGSTSTVLEAAWGASFRCATRAELCVLSEPEADGRRLNFSAFDPITGRGSQLLTLETHPGGTPAWDLSPDGATLAVVSSDQQARSVRLLDIQSRKERHTAEAPSRLSAVTWLADGRGLLATTVSVRGSSIIHFGMSGGASAVWTTRTPLGLPLASRDGKRVAFAVSTLDSNAWLLESF